MKLSELESVISLYMGNPNAPAIMLVSEAGIGKSSFIEQLGQKYGYRVHIFRGAEHDAVDLIGMPEVVEENGVKKTKFIPPDWVPTWDEKFIFFADEVNRARIDVRQACFRIAEMRGTETWKINRANHMVIMAVNPDDGEFQVEQLDLAFINRPSIYNIEPSMEDFSVWAFGAGININIINFLQANPNYLYVKPPSDYKLAQYPTPRSWANLSSLLNAAKVEAGNKLPASLYMVAAGNIGPEAAATFSTYLEDPDTPIDPAKIIEGLSEEDQKRFKKHQSKQDLVVKAMAAVLNLVAHIKAKPITDKGWNNVSKFYGLIESNDVKVALIKSLSGELYEKFTRFVPIDDIYDVAMETKKKEKELKK